MWANLPDAEKQNTDIQFLEAAASEPGKFAVRFAGFCFRISADSEFSRLNSLLYKPDKDTQEINYQKTLALKIMSLDLNTAEKTFYDKKK